MKFFFSLILICLLGIMSVSVAADNKKHVYVIHGYNASPDAHWFPWLKEKLTKQGIQVSVLAMPNPTSPNSTEWLQYLEKHIQSPDKNTFFVAHSLGCITLLKYLNTLSENTKIGGFVLVSGFSRSLSILPALDEFTNSGFDPAHIIALTKNRIVVASRDDSIVAYQQTADLSYVLKAKLFSVENGGHFLASDGFTQLPVVYEALQKMLY